MHVNNLYNVFENSLELLKTKQKSKIFEMIDRIDQCVFYELKYRKGKNHLNKIPMAGAKMSNKTINDSKSRCNFLMAIFETPECEYPKNRRRVDRDFGIY